MEANLFDELISSVKEMDEIAKGNQPPSRIFTHPDIEVKAIREKAGLSQSGFAQALGVSKRTVENWEQGRRRPAGTARSLLKVFDADPVSTAKTLSI